MSELLKIKDIELQLDIYNKDFILIKAPSSPELSLNMIAKTLYRSALDFVDEVITTETEILLKLNSNFSSKSILALSQIELGANTHPRSLNIPVFFSEHEDWKRIEHHTGLSKDDYISILCSSELGLAMHGFLPGFLYIRGIPSELQCPRKESPSLHIEENSFAIAEHYCGIYSLPSPGGWNVIGRIACPVINFPNIPPVLLEPGDNLRIKAINKSIYDSLTSSKINILEYNEVT